MQVDAVVLDIDGVLVDVADSYRRAIIESVERVCDKTIDRDAIQLFKDAGGFNNDWELTDAAALYVLARREGLGMDVETFTGRIAEGGAGLTLRRRSSATSPSRAGAGPRPVGYRATPRDVSGAVPRRGAVPRAGAGGGPRCRRRGTSTTSRPWWSRRRSLT